MTDTIKQAKLIQYLSEAYGKERELETALEAHIAMTTRKPYRKRLQEHLKETKSHARELERRIKKLGGGGPQLADKVAGQAVGKAKSLAKGPLHMVRGTGEAEKMLKNAKTEYFNEHEEIATYTAIETLAESRRRRRDGEARAGDPPRRGADGELPREADPGADQGRGRRGDPGRRAARERRPPRRRAAARKSRTRSPAARDERPRAQERAAALAGSRAASALAYRRTAERPCEARSAASRSSSRKSGWATSASASPRWWTVSPWSSAAPCSVTITSTWWRGVVITAPASNQGTIRERSSPPIVTVEGRQSSERSSSESAGPGDEVLVAADARVLGCRRSCRRRPGRGCRPRSRR